MSLDSAVSNFLLAPDRYLQCQCCQITFVWTGWEQAIATETPGHCPGCRHLLALTRRQRGVVKWYDGRKGFGFITTIDGSEIYVNRRSLLRMHALRRGQLVAFRPDHSEAGIQAIEVERLPKGRDESSGQG